MGWFCGVRASYVQIRLSELCLSTMTTECKHEYLKHNTKLPNQPVQALCDEHAGEDNPWPGCSEGQSTLRTPLSA